MLDIIGIERLRVSKIKIESLTGDTMSFEVLAEKSLAPAAVEAFAAELGVVGANTFANCESLHIFANRSDDTDGFMP